MAAQVALKRQQAAEDAIALGLRACVEGTLPMLQPGPLWGPGTVSPPEDKIKQELLKEQQQLANHHKSTSSTASDSDQGELSPGLIFLINVCHKFPLLVTL